MFKYRRLKDLREDRDYTQDYIADILKARRSSYANWENGETLIPLDKLDQLSVFYNVPISYLLGIENNYNRYKNIGKMNYNLMLDKLNQLKDNLSLTYQEIGDYLKVSKSTAYKYYEGQLIIPVNILILLGELYKCDIDKLLGKL